MLGMALLAWVMLASGAMAPFQVPGMVGMHAMAQATAATAMTHCHGVPDEAAAAPHALPTPDPHGDCCHAACHCMAACNAVAAVPRVDFSVDLSKALLPAVAHAGYTPAAPAPPLRPPIA